MKKIYQAPLTDVIENDMAYALMETKSDPGELGPGGMGANQGRTFDENEPDGMGVSTSNLWDD